MFATPLSVAKFRNLFALCWLIWSCLHTALYYWYGFPLSSALLDSTINNALLIGSCIVVSNVLRFYLPQNQRYSYILMLCVILTIIWFFISRVFIKMFTKDELDYRAFFTQSAPIKIGFGFLIIGCMALVSVVWYVMQEQQESTKRQASAERFLKEAELFALRQQLQPHFLFNSLNSINALIGLQPQLARTMIQQLSHFLRGTINKEEQVWSTVEEEIQHLQLYLDIEKVRFGHRLSTNIQIEESTRLQKLPTLLLQPVVENAIKFGLYETTGAIKISLKTWTHKGLLYIEVVNPFDPETNNNNKGTGFGLTSIERRLYLLFARNDLLKTNKEKDMFITTIKIPQPA